MKRLAIVSTHPIQYNAPLFRLLSERGQIAVKVFYTWSESEKGNIYDPGFGIQKAWDIPLLEGYPYQFSTNISANPGSHHFKGVINPALVHEIIAYEPDAVLVYGWSFHSHLKAIRYFKNKIPVLFRGDSTLLNEKKGFDLKKIIRRFFLKWVYSHVDHALYVGEYNKQYFRKHGMKEAHLTFMPHAIDNKRFAVVDRDAVDLLRKQLAIPEDDIVFLYAGKFEQVKNPFLLLRAFRQIKKENVHLLFVGSGELEAQLKEETGDEANVHFLPFQNQSSIPIIYSIADVFVLPSVSETWGLAINEAMASGKVVLVSNKCGCSVDLVKEEQNGCVFESGNMRDLQEKMDQLIGKNKKGLREMGKLSRHIINEWSYDQAAVALEKAVKSIA